jgi:hypothetical protein
MAMVRLAQQHSYLMLLVKLQIQFDYRFLLLGGNIYLSVCNPS